MIGLVEIKTPGAAEWSRVSPGFTVTRETIISTGFRSQAILSLGNSRLTVRPLTRLSLEDILLSRERETIAVNLRVGRVRAEVTPPPGGRVDFSVRSPTATASVRGTAFEFDTVTVQVDEGAVRLSPALPSAGPAIIRSSAPKSVTIHAGQTSYVDTLSERARPPRRIIPVAPPPIAGGPLSDEGPAPLAPIIETPSIPGGRAEMPPRLPQDTAPDTSGDMANVGIDVQW